MSTDPDKSKMQDLAIRWTKVQPAVSAFIMSAIRNFHDAEDVLQRTASSLVEKHAEYDASRSFEAWAVGIARIEILRYLQRNKRDRLVFDLATLDAVAEAYANLAPRSSEVREALEICVDQLQGRTRQVMQLRYAHSLTPSQVAKQLSMSANAVMVALHRARKLLRECVSRRLAEAGSPL